MMSQGTTYRGTGEAWRPIILALDTAGLACSVAVAAGNTVLGAERIDSVHGQAEALLPMVDRVMATSRLAPAALDLIAATVGPGSFTGIRVGLAAARGIALATGAQLVGVTSFEAVVAGCAQRDRAGRNSLLVSLESRREDLYAQLFDPSDNPLNAGSALLPADLVDAVNMTIDQGPLLIAGDAALRATEALEGRFEIVLLEDSAADAIGVLRAALRRIRLGQTDSSIRPLYLRSPDVTLPAKSRSTNLIRA
jgi:tRNA threonylcarbamoyladenosine biosynthesis protein TsaB